MLYLLCLSSLQPARTMKGLLFLSRRSFCSLKSEDFQFILTESQIFHWNTTIWRAWFTCFRWFLRKMQQLLLFSPMVEKYIFCFCTFCTVCSQSTRRTWWNRSADQCWPIFHRWCNFNYVDWEKEWVPGSAARGFNCQLSIYFSVPPLHPSVRKQILGGKVKDM